MSHSPASPQVKSLNRRFVSSPLALASELSDDSPDSPRHSRDSLKIKYDKDFLNELNQKLESKSFAAISKNESETNITNEISQLTPRKNPTADITDSAVTTDNLPNLENQDDTEIQSPVFTYAEKEPLESPKPRKKSVSAFLEEASPLSNVLRQFKDQMDQLKDKHKTLEDMNTRLRNQIDWSNRELTAIHVQIGEQIRRNKIMSEKAEGLQIFDSESMQKALDHCKVNQYVASHEFIMKSYSALNEALENITRKIQLKIEKQEDKKELVKILHQISEAISGFNFSE